MALHNVSDAGFEQEVLKQPGIVLVDFWATWCGPCKLLSPTLESFANEYPDVKVVKVDVDENQEVPMKYGVRGIPTLMVFKDGEVVKTKVGSVTKGQIVELVNV